MSPRFTYQTKRPCGACPRFVDAVRSTQSTELLVSRHLAKDREGFCGGSLAIAVEAPAKGSR